MAKFTPFTLRHLLGTGPALILEIGANDGEDSFRMSQAMSNRRTEIFCFECDPRAIKRWKKTVLNKRCHLIESALSNVSGMAPFHPSSGKAPGFRDYGEWDKSGSLLPCDRHTENAPWMSFKEPIQVPVTTLDSWADQNVPGRIIDFCWVDVQGAEHLVLLGGLKTLRRVRYWYCECDPRPNYCNQATIDTLKTILESNGFVYQGQYDGFNHLWKNTSVDTQGDAISTFTIDTLASTIVPSQSPSATPTFEPFCPTQKVTSIVTPFIGQFGNQLFQYVAGKIMAEVAEIPYVPPPTFLTKHGHPVSWTSRPLFLMRPTIPQEEEKAGPSEIVVCKYWVDWNKYKHASKMFMQGYFQRYECIKPWKDKIKSEWLSVQPPLPPTDPTALYIHCRRTDYIRGKGNPNRPNQHGIATTLKEYKACVKHFPEAKRLVVCTDDPNDKWLNCFEKLGMPWSISNGTWDQDFLALLASKWLVISQSTYSWWAGFLGKAERIACPLSEGTLWHFGKSLVGPPSGGRDYPNLMVDDEPGRWIWVEGVERA